MISLKNLKLATDQEVFDQVAEHLLRQNSKSLQWSRMDGGPGCAYRNKQGMKCAAGCLISDDEYDRAMEGKRWNVLMEERIVPKEHHDLILDLQDIHDYEKTEDWQAELDRLAEENNLRPFHLPKEEAVSGPEIRFLEPAPPANPVKRLLRFCHLG